MRLLKILRLPLNRRRRSNGGLKAAITFLTPSGYAVPALLFAFTAVSATNLGAS